MGGGWVEDRHLRSYASSMGRSYDDTTGRVSGGQVFESQKSLNELLDPRKFKIRECCIGEDHPFPIGLILGADVTGSMGGACEELMRCIGTIIKEIYKDFKDVEICIMGIGDLAYDYAPIQMSQFESDIRIIESLDKIWLEKHGGGNDFESYTAAWYMGLKRTKLETYDKYGQKGIIITFGDEPMNPYLPIDKLNHFVNGSEQNQKLLETKTLYEAAREKFDIYHIAVDDPETCYSEYKTRIEESFGKLLGNNLRVATLQTMSKVVVGCIRESLNRSQLNGVGHSQAQAQTQETGGIPIVDWK